MFPCLLCKGLPSLREQEAYGVCTLINYSSPGNQQS
jgi:hypothetical protein